MTTTPPQRAAGCLTVLTAAAGLATAALALLNLTGILPAPAWVITAPVWIPLVVAVAVATAVLVHESLATGRDQ